MSGQAIEANQVVGRYQVIERLGSGGMATVYLARMDGPAGASKLVAVKRIHPHLAAEPRFVHMFLDEWRIAAQIAHPNVCSVLDFGQTDDTYFLAMEHILGETLLSYLAAVQGRPEILDSATWRSFMAHALAEAAEGLHAAHELCDEHGQNLHVVHRDVSPDNIFVTYDGAVKVTDFGVARARGQLHQTQSGTVKGKFGYMPPEVLYGDTDFDRRVDVWALGVCLWELLVGQRLFRREAEAATISAIVNDPIPKPSDRRPDMPSELDDIVMAALQREPGDRTATARDFSRALRDFVFAQGEPMDMPKVAELARAIHPEALAAKQEMKKRARLSKPHRAITGPAGLLSGQFNAVEFHDGATPPAGQMAQNGSHEATPGVLDAVSLLDPDAPIMPPDTLAEARLREPPPSAPLPAGQYTVAAGMVPQAGPAPTARDAGKRRVSRALVIAFAVVAAAALGAFVAVSMVADDGATQTAGSAGSDESDTAAQATPVAQVNPGGDGASGENAVAAPDPAGEDPRGEDPAGEDPAGEARSSGAAGRDSGDPLASNGDSGSRSKDRARAERRRRDRKNRNARRNGGEKTRTGSQVDSKGSDDPDGSTTRMASTGSHDTGKPDAEDPGGKTEVPRVEIARPEMPKTEMPKTEIPKPAMPKTEIPRHKPTSFAAKAEIKSLKTRGPLSKAQVRGAVGRVQGSYQSCYKSAATRAGRIPAPTVHVDLEIDEQGWARNVKVSKSDLPGLSPCVQQAAKKIRSRTRPDIGRAKVSFQVAFHPRGR